MEFVEFALSIEKQGIDYYNKLAAQTAEKEASTIFTYLAQEEQRHYEIFDTWRRNAESLPVMDTGVFGGDPRRIFKQFTDHFETYGVPATHYYNAYEKALQFENKSISAYTEALEKLEDRKKKDVLTKIIDQEKMHAQFIDNMLQFLRHPGEWLENAEWVHHEEF